MKKPPQITSLKTLNADEERVFKENLAKERDGLIDIMSEARKERKDLSFKFRDKYAACAYGGATSDGGIIVINYVNDLVTTTEKATY